MYITELVSKASKAYGSNRTPFEASILTLGYSLQRQNSPVYVRLPTSMSSTMLMYQQGLYLNELQIGLIGQTDVQITNTDGTEGLLILHNPVHVPWMNILVQTGIARDLINVFGNPDTQIAMKFTGDAEEQVQQMIDALKPPIISPQLPLNITF